MSKTRYDFDHAKLEGVDKNIEISLKEYGIAWLEDKENYFFYYGSKYDDSLGEFIRFNSGWFSKSISLKKEFSWITDKDWKKVESFCDIFWEMSFMHQINTLYCFYGPENVFGTSSWEGFTFEEVISGDDETHRKRR